MSGDLNLRVFNDSTPGDQSPEVSSTRPPVTEKPNLPKLGYHLARMVLLAMFITLSGFLILLFVNPFDGSQDIRNVLASIPPKDSLTSAKVELIKVLQEEKTQVRLLTKDMAQTILVNVLLPVLTAIPGYISATHRAE